MYELVVVGTSAGGLAALETVVARLPRDYEIPILVVQHRSVDSELLGDVLQNCTRLKVQEVLDKEPIGPGTLYLAPPDYHVLVEPGELALSADEPVRFARPSIDVAFASAADVYGERLVGVVLTGANEDGAAGLRRIRERGGLALVQDPATAEVSRMPAAAARVPGTRVLSLEQIAAELRALPRVRRPRSRQP
jgi:two-component system chemotaxis response regulator CheB